MTVPGASGVGGAAIDVKVFSHDRYGRLTLGAGAHTSQRQAGQGQGKVFHAMETRSLAPTVEPDSATRRTSALRSNDLERFRQATERAGNLFGTGPVDATENLTLRDRFVWFLQGVNS